MGRTLDDIIASLAPARRRRIGARYRVLKDEVESLGALRRLAGKLELIVRLAPDVALRLRRLGKATSSAAKPARKRRPSGKNRNLA
jgi:hypothetical protein